MGKVDEEQALPSSDVRSEPSRENGWSRFRRLIGLRCVFFLLLSAAVFLSAIFWLPPFLHYADQTDLDLDSKFKGHDIVASFNIGNLVSLLEDHILQLEDDIFVEIYVPSAKVKVLSIEPLARSNISRVVFAVDPESKYSEIPPTSISLIKELFETLVINQSLLRLTTSLFGDPFFFEVLKFHGGITIIPPQSAFPLQKVQIYFNFTLNFSIYQIQLNFNELTSQLKLGLHLASYENLYVRLSNAIGSTLDAPTIVQSSVLLAVGNTPSNARLKQLAQTITGPHSKNLGLNNTVFGKVKQVRLSSILNHSLTGGDGSPSPAPLPHPHPPHHHHHHHHHHGHVDTHLTPAFAPAPAAYERETPPIHKGSPPPEYGLPNRQKSSAPPPEGSYNMANPPSCYHFKSKSLTHPRKRSHIAPTPSPDFSPHYYAGPPQLQIDPPAHASPLNRAYNPQPRAFYALHPPEKSKSGAEKSDSGTESSERSPAIASSPISSSAGQQTVQWALSLLLLVALQLL